MGVFRPVKARRSCARVSPVVKQFASVVKVTANVHV